MSSLRIEVFDAIENERAYQVKRWGNPDGTEREKDVASFLAYMQYYQNEAIKLVTKQGYTSVFARDAIRKIVALGVACLERHGVVERDPEDIAELG